MYSSRSCSRTERAIGQLWAYSSSNGNRFLYSSSSVSVTISKSALKNSSEGFSSAICEKQHCDTSSMKKSKQCCWTCLNNSNSFLNLTILLLQSQFLTSILLIFWNWKFFLSGYWSITTRTARTQLFKGIMKASFTEHMIFFTRYIDGISHDKVSFAKFTASLMFSVI